MSRATEVDSPLKDLAGHLERGGSRETCDEDKTVSSRGRGGSPPGRG